MVQRTGDILICCQDGDHRIWDGMKAMWHMIVGTMGRETAESRINRYGYGW
jgi:hypothetical protein